MAVVYGWLQRAGGSRRRRGWQQMLKNVVCRRTDRRTEDHSNSIRHTDDDWYTCSSHFLLLLLLVLQAPLGVLSAKHRHQSPEWTILSHASCFIQGQPERLMHFRSCWITGYLCLLPDHISSVYQL